MVNAKLSLSFPKLENESRTRYFPYINRLVKCPVNERKRTVQPRFPSAWKFQPEKKACEEGGKGGSYARITDIKK